MVKIVTGREDEGALAQNDAPSIEVGEDVEEQTDEETT